MDKGKIIDYMKISSFVAEHPDYYDKYEKEAIKAHAIRGIEHDLYTTDVIREICDHLGLIPEDKNIYVAFQKLIEEQFGIEGKHIVEVGGGIIPNLGKRIHLGQKTGSIIVYDPRLGKEFESEDRFTLKREEFKENTPIPEKTDLMIGLMPCKGAEALIDSALEHKKDFIVWLCEGGPHGDYFDYFESDEEWLDSTIFYATSEVESKKMGKLMVKKMEDFSEYPIIYNKKEN